MDWIILSLLYSGVISVVLYFNFCHLCHVDFRWYWCLLYAVTSCGLFFCRVKGGIVGFLYVLLGILLLAVFGTLFQKCRFIEAVSLSSLVISVYSIVDGIMQSFTYWIVSLTKVRFVLMCADFVKCILVILLLIFTFHTVRKSFIDGVKNMRLPILLILIVPVLFITLVETMVSCWFCACSLMVDYFQS